MVKKIYFAGSIRGGRIDADLYRRIIEHLQRGATVLTEHVGRSNLNLMEQGRQRDAAIFEQDTAWLRQCHLLVAECTCPSLGVGYELALAEQLGKPCHIFYDKRRTQLSAMLTGNPYYHIHPYESEDELFSLLDQAVNADSVLHDVRITAVRQVTHNDLMERYENPIEHTCDVKVGTQWTSVGAQRPHGLCQEAWKSMKPFVESLARGEGNFYDGWMKNPMSAMISCNDGFRPMSFLLEVDDTQH